MICLVEFVARLVQCSPAKKGRADVAEALNGIAPSAVFVLKRLKPLAALFNETRDGFTTMVG